MRGLPRLFSVQDVTNCNSQPEPIPSQLQAFFDVGWAGEWENVSWKNALCAALGAFPLSSAIISCEGDSLTFGAYSTDPYPDQLADDWIYPATDVTFHNNGASGSCMLHAVVGYASIMDRSAAFDAQYNAAKTHNIAILCGGTNDIAIATVRRSAADTHADIAAWCAARKAVGWDVLVCTLPANRHNAYVAYWGDLTTTRLELNELIRENWRTYADGLVDLGADPILGSDAKAYASKASPLIWVDGLHFDALGDRMVARLVKNAIAML